MLDPPLISREMDPPYDVSLKILVPPDIPDVALIAREYDVGKDVSTRLLPVDTNRLTAFPGVVRSEYPSSRGGVTDVYACGVVVTIDTPPPVVVVFTDGAFKKPNTVAPSPTSVMSPRLPVCTSEIYLSNGRPAKYSLLPGPYWNFVPFNASLTCGCFLISRIAAATRSTCPPFAGCDSSRYCTSE
jgi:hypothetical protein